MLLRSRLLCPLKEKATVVYILSLGLKENIDFGFSRCFRFTCRPLQPPPALVYAFPQGRSGAADPSKPDLVPGIGLRMGRSVGAELVRENAWQAGSALHALLRHARLLHF